MLSLLYNNTYIPSAFAGLGAFVATLVIIDFISYTSTRYKDRYLKEAAVELDEVLLQIPANRVFDLSLALSALFGFLTVLLFATVSDSFSWTKGCILGLMVAILMLPVPRIILRFLKKQRLKKFNEQLEDALNSMGSALKAGFSITQALEGVAKEDRPPISVEFRLLLQEIRLGVPLEKALDNLTRRMESADFELIATAIITARQTGGELTVIFERLASVIRERARITNKLNAMTAQGKIQTIIICFMPVILLFAMTKVAPATMDIFFNDWRGIVALLIAGGMIAGGCLMIRKILKIDI